MPKFELNPIYTPIANQPAARDALSAGIEAGDQFQTLLGVTGSGKTATMAFTIEKLQRPALVAAVIYEESRFRDQTSHAGARGLMQITPDTAKFIAQDSGGTAFTQADLATPQVNISYGAYYLRYLLKRYDQNTVLALAAYNGGEGNVDRWLAEASMSERTFGKEQIPFTETREYVDRVLDARVSYRERYSRELGL